MQRTSPPTTTHTIRQLLGDNTTDTVAICIHEPTVLCPATPLLPDAKCKYDTDAAGSSRFAMPTPETIVVEDPPVSASTNKLVATSPHQRLMASCRNYFSRRRRVQYAPSRPTSPALEDDYNGIVQGSRHHQRSISSISQSSSMKRAISSPCLREACASPQTRCSRLQSHHVGSTSFSSRSEPFGKTNRFSTQGAAPLMFVSCTSMRDYNQIWSLHKQNVASQPIAATIAPEILSWILRYLMNRKCILNCSLVCRNWHGPARVELALFLRDMPYNGQGLIQAIRTRFASETVSTLSVSVFDRLLWNLAEVYYYSNPEMKAIFAPQHPPDMLYHLFWTFLFVDQEFRNPRTKSKAHNTYYIRLLQEESCGYPKQYFHKKAFKNMLNDIRAKPLLPTPHLIQALQALGDGQGVQGGAAALNSLIMRFSGSLRIEDSLRRIRRWWRNMRELGSQNFTLIPDCGSTATMDGMARNGDDNASIDMNETLQASEANDTYELSGVSPLSFPESYRYEGSGSRCILISPVLNRGSLFSGSGSRSDMGFHPRQHPRFMNDGFTSAAFGWHPDGDGLDGVIKLPISGEPSRLGERHRVLQVASLVAEMKAEEDGDGDVDGIFL